MGEMIKETETTGMENAGITLTGDVIPAVIQYDFDAVSKQLDMKMQEYSSLVVTDDTLAGCKNAKKELASLRNRLEELRKEKKRELEKPVKEFDTKCKKLQDQITKVETPLSNALAVYDEKERQKKRDFAQKQIDAAVENYGLRPEYAAKMVIKNEFLNVTTTQKSVKADVIAQAEALQKEQSNHDASIDMIRQVVEKENERLSVKLDAEDMVSQFESGTDVLILVNRIHKQAENIFQQEQRMEEERKRREEETRRKEAEEAAARAAAIRDAEAQAENDEASPSEIEPAHRDGKECANSAFMIPEELETELGLYSEAPDLETGAQEVPVHETHKEADVASFAVTFRVTGEFSVLRSLNNYLKEKGICFEVIEQKKI